MKSKIMLLEKFRNPLVYKEIEIPKINSGQILVKMDAAGVCGSDVHMQMGEDERTPLPIILGHEGVGTVVEIAGYKETVDGIEINPGDRVIWNRGVSCGHCFECKILLNPSLCLKRKVYGISRSFLEFPHLNGCFSEYIVLSENTDLFKVNKNIDPAVMVGVSCSGATVAHAFDKVKILPGDSVLIQGPGPLGIFSVAFAKEMGAKNIIIVGGTPERLENCAKMGATHTINRNKTNPKERLEIIKDITAGRNVQIIVETAGTQGAVEEGLNWMGFGGAYLSVGYSQPAGVEKIDFFKQIVRKDASIHGVWVSDTRHTYQALQIVLKNPDKFSGQISHRYPLADLNHAFDDIKAKKTLKAVVTSF